MLNKTDWTSLKQINTDNNFKFYYTQDGNEYSVIEGNSQNIYWSNLKDSAEITDWETNFKPTAITVLSLDDAVSRISLPVFKPRFYSDQSSISVGDTEVLLTTITATAKLDAITAVFDRSEVEFIVIVDGVEIFREILKDLDDTLKYNLGQGNGQFFPVKILATGKQIAFNWYSPPDFKTDLVIKAKRTSASPTNKKTICIAYREQS